MNVIPKPHKYEKLGGEFHLNPQTTLFSEEIFSAQAHRFAQLVQGSCGFLPQFVESFAQAQIIFTFNEQCGKEEYHLMIAEGVATVSASTETGCFYAVETLRQLFRLDCQQTEATYNNCYIEDAPTYAYRGLSLDLCRHFFPLETIKQIVELMSRAKLNKLHLHLSDDQGYRLQSLKYPLLNQVGSVREGSEVLQNGNRFVDDNRVEGHLTLQQAQELVQFAAQHMVEIVPEIDIPGHAEAMIASYPHLSCEGAPIEVRKKWGVSKEILCAGNDETYTFLKDILDEVCSVFPGEFVHLGGDEAPKDKWCNCKKCREKLAQLGLGNFEQLQAHMTEQLRQHLEGKGKTVICWNDGISKTTSDKIVSQVWKPLSRRNAVKQANRGRQTIMSPLFHMYFDYPYAMTPLKKTYKFNPSKGVKKCKLHNVLGVEGAVWTEYIATEEKLWFNLLPRMIALAEVAWGTNSGEFAKRATQYVQLYDKLGLPYFRKAMVKVHKRVRLVKHFFRKNPNVELDLQNKALAKEE